MVIFVIVVYAQGPLDYCIEIKIIFSYHDRKASFHMEKTLYILLTEKTFENSHMNSIWKLSYWQPYFCHLCEKRVFSYVEFTLTFQMKTSDIRLSSTVQACFYLIDRANHSSVKQMNNFDRLHLSNISA